MHPVRSRRHDALGVAAVGVGAPAAVAIRIGRISEYGYESEVIHLSDYIPSPAAPAGGVYDGRVRRLMAAGNALCALNDLGDKEGGRASIARLAVLRIMLMRAQLHRQDNRQGDLSTLGLMPRPNTAYILHSLKRVEEVQLLRQIYGGQFILLGSQDSHDNRLQELLSRPLSGGTVEGRMAAAEKLMRIDADDTQGSGQRINKTYPLADYFLSSTDPERFFKILFGFPIAPLVDEYAMYAAEGAFGRSLAASRKVGAALVQNESLIATGYNDVPHGQTADVLAGQDTSEVFKRNNVRDTLERDRVPTGSARRSSVPRRRPRPRDQLGGDPAVRHDVPVPPLLQAHPLGSGRRGPVHRALSEEPGPTHVPEPVRLDLAPLRGHSSRALLPAVRAACSVHVGTQMGPSGRQTH